METTRPHATEQWLRLALDAAGLTAWVWDVAAGTVAYSTHESSYFQLPQGQPMRTVDMISATVYPPDIPAYERAAAGARERGEPFQIQLRAWAPDGQLRWLEVRALAQRDAEGRPAWVVGVTRDITAEKRRQAARSFQLALNQALSPALDVGATLEVLARLPLPELADACAVFLLDERGRLRRAGASGVADGPQPDAGAGPPAALEGGGPALLEAALRDGAPRLLADVPPELAASLAAPAPRSAMLVPLAARGQTLGIIQLGRLGGELRYDADDLALAEALGRCGAEALVGARLEAAASAAEQAAAEAHARLDALVMSAPSGIGYLDGDLRYVLVNPALAALNGRPAAEHLGRTLGELLPGLAPRVEPLMRQVLTTGAPVLDLEIQGKISPEAGPVQDWLVSYFPVLGRGSEVMGIGVTVANVTQRKRTETALRDTERKLGTLFELLPVGVSILDAANTIVYLNPALERILRLDRAALFGGAHTTRRYLRSDGAPMRRDEYASALIMREQKPVSNVETGIVTESGEVIWTSVSAAPVDFPDWRTVIVTSDITARKEAEIALRTSTAKLEAALDSMTDAVFMSDVEGRFLEFNDAFATFHRFRSRDECAKTFAEYPGLLDVYFPDGALAPVEQWAVPRALRGETVTNVEYTVRRKDTGETWVGSYSFAPIRAKGGAITGAVVVARDVTERKLAEERVRAAFAAEQAARVAAEAATERTLRLQAVTAALAGVMTQDAVIGVMTDHGVVATGASAAVVGLVDAAGEQLEMVGWSGRSAEELAPIAPLPLSDALPMAVAARTRSPVWITSRADAEARFPGFSEVMALYDDHALANLPLIAGAEALGTMCFGYRAPNAFAAEEQAFMLTLARQCAQALERARLYAEVLASRRRLQDLSQRLLQTQEQERRHLARELHDEVGQALTGLRLALELAGRVPPEERDDRLAEAHQAIQELIGRVRTLSLDLRPAMLDDRGLLPAVLWLLRRYREQTGIAVELRHWGLERRMPQATETVAYRIVQEALTNVARHAGVSAATVHMLASASQLLIQVRDLGRGFVLEAALMSGLSSGLAGMQERVGLLGGRLTIETSPGAGTCVTAELPLEEPCR